jgi:hypothetical protein
VLKGKRDAIAGHSSSNAVSGVCKVSENFDEIQQ